MRLFSKPKAGDKDLILKKTHDFCGSREPELLVVCVHGIASDSSAWSHALQYCEGTTSLKNVRFVAFDLLGSGESYSSDDLNYDYRDQITALHNAIVGLKCDLPMVMIGHSMGTLIATRYASTYKKSCRELILISPPVYRPEDLENPAFMRATKAFEEAVAMKSRATVESKAFRASMEKIVFNKYNYKRLCELTTPAVLIYGETDPFIAPFNIPKVLRENPRHLTAMKTPGRHGISRDKYSKLPRILEEVING